MIIRRGVRPRRYTVVDNETIEDEKLTWEARGLLIYLLSKPDHWRINRDHLAAQAPNGVAMVRRILSQLEEHGYLVRQRIQGEGGRIEWESVVYEVPAQTIGMFAASGPATGGSADEGAATNGAATGGESSVLVMTEAASTDQEAPESKPSAFAEDADRLCELLADLIEANGSKRPTITASWRTEAERMLRLDGRDPGKVERCIRWSQTDSFWRANILSMPKLRSKYGQLRLAAKRDRGREREGTMSQLRGLSFDENDRLIDPPQERCS